MKNIINTYLNKLLIILILFFSINIYGQKIEKYDTIYNMQNYIACYNKTIQTSSFVIYKLYQGGGDESRTSLTFKSYNKLPHFNYTKSGYDRGHLVPAEDFGYDLNKIKSTFYYINCIPQTVRLNRGIWKTYEIEIRKKSQKDSLLIICGGCDYEKGSLIPYNCFKIVYNLRTHTCIYSLLFRNGEQYYVMTENKLKRKLTFKKSLQIYNDNINK